MVELKTPGRNCELSGRECRGRWEPFFCVSTTTSFSWSVTNFTAARLFVARDVAFGPLSLAPAWADQESMERVRVRPRRNAKVFPPENPIDGTKHCQNCGLTCF